MSQEILSIVQESGLHSLHTVNYFLFCVVKDHTKPVLIYTLTANCRLAFNFKRHTHTITFYAETNQIFGAASTFQKGQFDIIY